MRFRIAAGLGLAWLTACTGPSEAEGELQAVQQKVTRMERELAELKERIRAAEGDQGLKLHLTEEEELLRSRLERVRERARNAAPNPAKP